MSGTEGLPEEVAPAVSVRKLLGRDDILWFDDRQYEYVEVPEWGEGAVVKVRGMTGSERDAFEGSLMKESADRKRGTRMDWTDLRSKLIVRCVVDEQGERIFTDADVKAVGNKSAAALQRIFEVCQKLSRLTDEDVDELVGNSNGNRSGEGGSD